MSLDRKDIRGKLDPDFHAAFIAICEADGVTQAEFIERVLAPIIRDRVHAATVIAEKTVGLGLTGNNRESSGAAGK